MPRLSRHDLDRVEALRASLGTLPIGGPPALAWLSGPLQELLRSPHVVTYSYRPRGEGVGVDVFSIAGESAPRCPNERAHRIYDDYVATKRLDFQAFNPTRPEPSQRNRVLSLAELLALAHRARVPVQDELLADFGDSFRDQLRVVVCDGPSFLAWVGAFQAAPFDARQRMILSRLVAPLQRRLLAERALYELPALRAAFDAAFEAIAGPAYLVSAAGRIEHANAAGLALLEAEPDTRLALREAASAGVSERFALSRLDGPSVPLRWLARRQGRAAPREVECVEHARRRYGLTPRQVAVLRMLVEGRSNATIAAELAISERTVEDHLRAMFDKAGADQRTQLVAQVLAL